MTPAIFGLSGLVLTDAERGFFREVDPAGYILFGRNIDNRDQVRALTDELRALHGREHLLITIDQEGGRVRRMKDPVWPYYPPGGAFDRLYGTAPASAIEAARASAQAMGMDLAEVGVTMTHAPVLDVRQPGAHDVIGDRALGSEPMRVAALGRAMLDGLARAGVAGTIKHMPGHGRSMVDTHKELPTVTATAEELEWDLAPFRQLAARAPSGMTGHLIFTAWDKANPATLSPVVIEKVIRGKIGFDGLLFTDDLDMEALTGTVPDRAARAIAAGCDLALNCWARMDDMVGIAKVLPPLPPKGHERLERALRIDRSKATGETQAELLAKRDALLALAPAESAGAA